MNGVFKSCARGEEDTEMRRAISIDIRSDLIGREKSRQQSEHGHGVENGHWRLDDDDGDIRESAAIILLKCGISLLIF